MRCPTCWAWVGQTDRFCEKCGTALKQPPEQNGGQPVGLAPPRRRIGGSAWGPAQAEARTTGEVAVPQGNGLPVPEPTHRRRRSVRKRRWYRRWPVMIVLAILLVAGTAAAAALYQADSTLDQLHRVSTPPPRISDQTARQEESSQEVAQTGGETATGSLEELEQIDSSSSEPKSHSQSSLQPIPAPSDQEPVPTGSDGGETETVDQTARSTGQTEPSDTGAGPETSGEGVNSSEPRTSIGQQAGNRSDEQGDFEARAEEQLAAGMSFDTGPAREAIEAAERADEDAGDSDGGLLDGIRDRGGEVKDLADGAAAAAGISDPDAQPMTILVMGVDAREGSAIDIGVRPDALMVLRLDPESESCRGLAVPRDSLAELPGYGETKINHALMLGGIPYEQLVVQQYLGIEIDHYALIDFTGFQELVDAVGGITIEVPPELVSPAVAGTQRVTGEQALLHARYRGGPDGDFGRIERQQEIMRGLIAAADGRDLLGEARRLLPALEDHVRTDLSIDALVSLASYYQRHCTTSGLTMDTIPGEVVYGPIIDPLLQLPLSYVVSDEADIEAKVEALFQPDE
jgi:LCP family protein required for cell wall assembly